MLVHGAAGRGRGSSRGSVFAACALIVCFGNVLVGLVQGPTVALAIHPTPIALGPSSLPESPPQTVTAPAARGPSVERALVAPRPRISPSAGESPAPGYNETSEFFAGHVGVAVFLVESDGSAYNWNDAEVNQTQNGIVAGLSWWATEEPKAHLSFSYEYHIREPTTWEPIQAGIINDVNWIGEILANRGYTEIDPFEQALHFNNDLRDRLGTDWAYSIFVADSDPTVNFGLFADDQIAHAYLGGPWVTMSRFSPASYNADDYYVVVPAHETGHIFYATDEYDLEPTEFSGYLNCPDQNGSTGIMNRNTQVVSPTTRCQIGWVDTDADGILDILDVPPEVTLAPYGPDPTTDARILHTGTATVLPLANRNPYGSGRDVTLSRLVGVEVSVDNGSWIEATPVDGAFDGPAEPFTFAVEYPSETQALPLPNHLTTSRITIMANATSPSGIHEFRARTVNTEGNEDISLTDALALSPRNPAQVELWYRRNGGPDTLYANDSSAPWRWEFDTGRTGGDGEYEFYTIAVETDGTRESVPGESDVRVVVDSNPFSVSGPYGPYALIATLAGAAAVAIAIAWIGRRRLRNRPPQTP